MFHTIRLPPADLTARAHFETPGRAGAFTQVDGAGLARILVDSAAGRVFTPFREEKTMLAKSTLLACALAAPFFAPALLKAGNRDHALAGHSMKAREVSQKLAEFDSGAVALRQTLGRLETLTRTKKSNWTSHALALVEARSHINGLGRTLAELEALRPYAGEFENKAIAEARPRLVRIAAEVESKIRALNQDSRIVVRPHYRQSALSLYGQSEDLVRTVDTILGYKNARLRLKALELRAQPPSGDGA